MRGGAAYVLLRSAAYGRYLALWARPAPAPAPQGHGGHPVLRAFDDPDQDDVLLRHGRDDTSFVGVTGDSDNHDDTRRTHWVVEAIPPRRRPPFLPAPVPVSSPSLSSELLLIAFIWSE